jgi:hypothetical protein
MEEQFLTAKEQEVLFGVIIRKIPSVKDPDRLMELVTQALALMLRRPGDRKLREDLTQCVADLFAGAHFVPPSSVRKAAELRRAIDCIEVLRAAREHRLPRDIVYPADVRDREAATAASTQPVPHPAHLKAKGSGHGVGFKIFIGVVVLTVAGIGGALWRDALDQKHSIFDDAKEFTATVINVATTAADAQSKFGGKIKFKRAGGHGTVIADAVPPAICAASGWELVHQGTLTVNGVTPRRVSSALITELCYDTDGTVTLIWEPKDQSLPTQASAQPAVKSDKRADIAK